MTTTPKPDLAAQPAAADGDAAQTVRELRVQLIELERQNEELRTAQVAMEAERARYLDIYDLAPVGYCTLAEPELIQEANPTASKMLGTTLSALRQQPIARFIFKEDQDIYYGCRRKLLATGEAQECELRLVRPDGTHFWASFAGITVKTGDGARAVHITFSDISARKQAETDLRVSQMRLVDAQTVTKTGSWETDLSSLAVVWSAQTYRTFDLDPNTFQASHPAFLDFVHPQDREIVDVAFLQSFESSTTNTLEHRIVTATGATKWVEERWRIERNSQGVPMRAVGTCQDITERKQADAALRESEHRFHDLLMNIPSVAVQGYREDGTASYWNEASERLYGYRADEVIGRNLLDLIVPPEMHDGVREAMRGMFHTTTPIPAGELSLLRKDGSRVDVFSSHAYVRVPGKSPEMFCMDVDITERKHFEQSLQQSLKDKQALLMEVNHRVKNNLQVVSSLLRLEGHRSQQKETKAVLAEMQGRIHSMALLHKMLYRSGTFASVDLGSYVEQVASQAFSTQSLSSGSVRLSLHVGSVQVGMDQAIAAGLLVNELISNCLKHAFPLDRSGEVRVVLQPVNADASQADPMWRLEVSDTGVGLPADVDQLRKASLGLQLANDLGEQIGGSLKTESRQGQGTQFTLIFAAIAPQSLVMPL